MEAGIERIESLVDVRREIDFGDPWTSRWNELDMLMEEVEDMGYEFIREETTWVLNPQRTGVLGRSITPNQMFR